MSEQLSLLAETDADKLISEAQVWRDENPNAYAAIVAWAYEDAARGRICAMQKYIEALRDPAYARAFYVHRTDTVYLLNHNKRSALTRLVMREHTDLPFRIRKSVCDKDRGTEATPRP